MALARFAFSNLRHKLPSPSPSFFFSHPRSLTETTLSSSTPQKWSSGLIKRTLSTTSATDDRANSDGREVSVSEGSKNFKLPTRRRRRRSLWPWRNNDRQLVPPLSDLFSSGFGNALVQATENMNRVLENLSPSHLMKRFFTEKDDSYHLKYQMPGLSKEDVKITVEDSGRLLVIRGEHKEEEEEGSDDDEFWSAASYGYYNTTLLLPEDAKTDEIKAEMKHGVLYITIPKAEVKKKDMKEVPIQ